VSTAQRELVRAERTDLREFVATLSSEQWTAPSLCAGWTVWDVVVHLVANTQVTVGQILRGAPGTLVNFGKQMDRSTADRMARFADLSNEQLVAAFDASMRLDRPYADLDGMPWFGRMYVRYTPAQALADTVIHHQDIRRPLGLPRVIPPERVHASLQRVVASRWVFGGNGRARGLRVQANDVAFARGDGPLVSGPGEALLLALSGRVVALDELAGEGLVTLRSRVGN